MCVSEREKNIQRKTEIKELSKTDTTCIIRTIDGDRQRVGEGKREERERGEKKKREPAGERGTVEIWKHGEK